MAFVAGAITGNLLLNTSGFTGGITGAISAAVAGGPSIAGPILAALNAIEETAKSVAHVVADTIRSVGREFDNMGEAAERAGVSVGFLTGVGAAAKDSGGSVQALGDAMKFLNKSIAEAMEGNQEAQQSFARVGVTLADLQGGDTESVFLKVADGVKGLGTAAEKTRSTLALLGRSDEIIPLLNQGSAAIQAFAQDVEALGGTVTQHQAEIGDKFGKLEILGEAAFTGIKHAFADPFLEVISDNFDVFKGTITDVADAVRAAVPAAIGAVKIGFEVAQPVVQLFLETLREIAVVSDALGATDNLAPKIGKVSQDVDKIGGLVQNINANVYVDPRESSGQVADKLLPHFDEAQKQYVDRQVSSTRRQLVAAGAGGRAR